jgi:hypothetical protein
MRELSPGVSLGMTAIPRMCLCPNFNINHISVKLTNPTGWLIPYPSIIPIIFFHPFPCEGEGHNHEIPGYPSDSIDIYYLEGIGGGWQFFWGSIGFDNQPQTFTGANGWLSWTYPFGYGISTTNARGCHPDVVPGYLGHVESDAGGSADLELIIP